MGYTRCHSLHLCSGKIAHLRNIRKCWTLALLVESSGFKREVKEALAPAQLMRTALHLRYFRERVAGEAIGV